jgi:hypothetical protein
VPLCVEVPRDREGQSDKLIGKRQTTLHGLDTSCDMRTGITGRDSRISVRAKNVFDDLSIAVDE